MMMYPFLILIFLGVLAASRLTQEVFAVWPVSSQGPKPRNNTIEPHPTLPAKPQSTHFGRDDGSDVSSCHFLTDGFGPLPEEDTPEAFRQFQLLYNISTQAVEPNGYSCTLSNVDGSIEPGAGYLGLEFLEQYNSTRCAELCNDRPRCGSFNIYFERDPLYDPSRKLGCPNPVSTNNIKCVLWQSSQTEETHLNRGEIRVAFEVVIAGSNVYDKKDGVAHFDGFVGPRDVDNNAAFDVPLEPIGGYDTVLGRDVFEYNSTFTTYDASVCASLCEQFTQRNSESSTSNKGPFLDGAFAACTMFVAFELRRDNDPVAMVCDSFSSVWSTHYQTLRGLDDLLVFKVSAFQREDYQYPPICAIEEHCKGDEYYPGGDCSGWGPEKCQPAPEDVEGNSE